MFAVDVGFLQRFGFSEMPSLGFFGGGGWEHEVGGYK